MTTPIPSLFTRLRLGLKRRMRGQRVGDYATKRTTHAGLEFDTLRQYEQGDDIRRIDWNSSVRTGSLMVRSFTEHHNRTIIIAVDISRSTHTGSTHELKSQVLYTIASALCYATANERDAVGVCLLNNEETLEYIPPRSGKEHRAQCLNLLQSLHTQRTYTEKKPQVVFPKNSWVILLTDGLTENYTSWWRQLAARSHVTLVRVRDRYERTAPPFCTITYRDPESQRTAVFTPQRLQEHAHAWYHQQLQYAKKLNINALDIIAGEPYEALITRFFEQGA